MIIDVFLYNGEKECLEIRCEEMKHLHVIHVLVEGGFTFTGRRKYDFFYKQKELSLLRLNYGIRDYIIWDMPNNGNAWDNEIFQRNEIANILSFLSVNDDDIIILSDVDEIPSEEAIKKYKPEMGLTALRMDNFWYKFNCLTERQTWVAPKMCTYEYFKTTTPNEIRNSGYPSVIDNAGFHFSYLGDDKYISNKLHSFSHKEYNIPQYNNNQHIKHCIESGISLWGNSQFEFIKIDESFPKYLYQNQDKFKHLIHENNPL